MEFEIESTGFNKEWYIGIKEDSLLYLFKTGKVMHWSHDWLNTNERRKQIYFDTREEAERFLIEYKEDLTSVVKSTVLSKTIQEKKRMTGKEARVDQCKKDIETLQEELVKLQTPKPLKAGDVVRAEFGSIRFIVRVNGGLRSIDPKDGEEILGVRSESDFRSYGYKKIGRIADYIK